MKSQPKYLILLIGVPASGKTYLSHQLASKLTALSINHKILSTDNLEAFLTHHPNFEIQNIQKFFSSPQWHLQLTQFKLNKQNFNDKAWSFSRKVAENSQILDLLFLNCQILIIQDELPLKSQRKPYKKYCSDRNIKFLEIQMHISLEEALQNNHNRGQQNEKQKVSNQVITKSFEKYESSPDALILTKQTVSDFLNQEDILSHFKTVDIHDNYTEYLSKKKFVHEYAQKQMDENEIRKLITKIMKDETVASEYLLLGLQSKEKAYILAECKKTYIQQKRKVAFKVVVQNFMSKSKDKQSEQQETKISQVKPCKEPKQKQLQNSKQQHQ